MSTTPIMITASITSTTATAIPELALAAEIYKQHC